MKWPIYLVLLGLAGAAGANPGPVDYGVGTTLGNVSSGGIPGQRHNPAAAWFRLGKKQNFRSGILSLGSVAIEAGESEDFIERVEALEGCLADVVRDCRARDGSSIRPDGDIDISLDEAVALQSEFNTLLRQIGEDAYVILDAQFQLPATPMVFRALEGVMGLDINVSGTANLSVLDDPLRFNPISGDVETNTAAYLKTARFINVGLSYSRQLKDPFAAMFQNKKMLGELIGGVRLTIMQGALAKIIAAVDSDDGTGETAFDRAEDAYKDAEETGTNVALDLGLLWQYKSYAAGLTLRNINAPTFDYGPVGVDCASLPTLGRRQDCSVAAFFANRIDQREEFELNPQATIDGTVYFQQRQLQLSASADLNAANSPVGDEYQWLMLGLAYVPSNRNIPGLRLGYRSNIGDEGVDSMSLGLTLFGVFNLDVSQAFDRTEIDGDEVPRAAAISLGFEMPL